MFTRIETDVSCIISRTEGAEFRVTSNIPVDLRSTGQLTSSFNILK